MLLPARGKVSDVLVLGLILKYTFNIHFGNMLVIVASRKRFICNRREGRLMQNHFDD